MLCKKTVIYAELFIKTLLFYLTIIVLEYYVIHILKRLLKLYFQKVKLSIDILLTTQHFIKYQRNQKCFVEQLRKLI